MNIDECRCYLPVPKLLYAPVGEPEFERVPALSATSSSRVYLIIIIARSFSAGAAAGVISNGGLVS